MNPVPVTDAPSVTGASPMIKEVHMAIVISRKSGEILQAPEYTQEQKDMCWERITQVWAQRNQDVLKNLKEQAAPMVQRCS